MTTGINCSAYILAGGKSSRMGEDKGLMMFNGQAVVKYVIDALEKVTDEIVIVSNNAAYKAFGLEVIPDEITDMGPAGGICAALQHSTSEYNLILGCDMPFVTGEALAALLTRAKGAQITLPMHHGQLEPLLGVYATSCKDEWQRLVKGGMVKLQELVKHFDLRQMDTENDEYFTSQVFMNINTRQEFNSALKQL